MDLQLPFSNYTTLPSFLFLVFMTIIVVAKIYKTTPKRLPPGPPKLPIIGNIHQLLGSLPHQAMRLLSRRYGRVMHLQLGQISIVVLSSPQTAREVMKTHDSAVLNRPDVLGAKIVGYDGQGVFFSPYGAYWRQMRKICTMEVLSNKNVRSYSYIREDEVGKLIESARSSSGLPFNVSETMGSLGASIIARAAFGKKSQHQDALLPFMHEAIASLGGLFVADLYPSVKILPFLTGMKARLEKVHRNVDTVLQKILDEHKASFASGKRRNGELGQKDLLDVLLEIQDSHTFEFPITDTCIKAVIMDMLFGGTTGSSSIIEWAMSELIRNPRVMEKLQNELRQSLKGKKVITEKDVQELNYLKLVIKETFRLHPPGPLLLPRESTEDFEINGYAIPKMTRLFVNVWAIARDPQYWDDPEEFKPERFEVEGDSDKGSSSDYNGGDFKFMPFGLGRRICPGINFSIASIELPLAQILFHFDWKLPNGMEPEDLDMTEKAGLSASRNTDLFAIPIPYHDEKKELHY